MRLKADLHIHSTYSDGRASPVEIIYTAIEKGLDVIAITDHNTFRGGVAGYKASKNIPDSPIVIIGNEVRTQLGDILVYCLDEVDIPYSVPEIIDRGHEDGCLVVPAHPFDILRLGIGEALFDYSGWDAVEVWNASSTHRANRRAIEAAKLLRLPGLANSDAHILEYIGVAYTLIEVDEYSVEGVFKAIKKGLVHPHYGYPPFKHLFKRFFWSLEKFFRTKTISQQ